MKEIIVVTRALKNRSLDFFSMARKPIYHQENFYDFKMFEKPIFKNELFLKQDTLPHPKKTVRKTPRFAVVWIAVDVALRQILKTVLVRITSISELRSSAHVDFYVVSVRVLRGGVCEVWGAVVPMVSSCRCKR